MVLKGGVMGGGNLLDTGSFLYVTYMLITKNSLIIIVVGGGRSLKS